jgi:hypothetical protein
VDRAEKAPVVKVELTTARLSRQRIQCTTGTQTRSLRTLVVVLKTLPKIVRVVMVDLAFSSSTSQISALTLSLRVELSVRT